MILDNQVVMVGTTSLQGLSTEDCNDLLYWHDNNKTLLKNVGSIGLYNPWLHTTIRDIGFKNNFINVEGVTPGSPWNPDFVKNFPNLVASFNELPFLYIHKIIILETIKECVSHIDGSAGSFKDKSYEPYGYRMLLRDSINSNGFYVQGIEPKDFGCGPRKQAYSPYPRQHYSPEVGKWWVLNNWCCQHGSDWKDGDNKALISVLGIPSEGHKTVLNSLTNIIKHPEYSK